MVLQTELNAAGASDDYRIDLATSLLYKVGTLITSTTCKYISLRNNVRAVKFMFCCSSQFALYACDDIVADRLKSGATVLERPVSSGTQSYETDEDLWPVNEFIPKISSRIQV